MTSTDLIRQSSSLADLINNSNGRTAVSSGPAPRLSRTQIVDISMALDALFVYASFVLSQLVYPLVSSSTLDSSASYTLGGVLTGLVHYVVMRARQPQTRKLLPNSIGVTFRSLLITFAIVIALGYGLKQAELHSRLWLFLSFALAFVMISAKNWILHAAISKGLLQEFVVARVALFGDATITQSLKQSLESEYQNLCRITTYEGAGDDADSAAGGDQLNDLIADGLSNKFDRIVICLPPGKIDQMKRIVDAISFLSARIEACLGHAELRTMQQQMLLAPSQILIDLDERPDDSWGPLLKRVIDLTLGTAFLMAAAPVIFLAAVAIKLESKGPVFFRQRRHGWNHSIISVWKLRTMTVQEDGDTIKQAVRNDPRVTRVGRFLRKTSIDELPQLINVLMGEMSLVGPRPHALAHNVHYSRLIASYACRHKVKPGLTGWAQIKGLRGNSEDISKMAARAEADIWYVRNWSILLDIKIIVMTPIVLLFQKNAL